jgi:hypothetical protein
LRLLENPIQASCTLATLYNTRLASGNGCLCFLLIVFTFTLERAWKTGHFSGFRGFFAGAAMYAPKAGSGFRQERLRELPHAVRRVRRNGL